MTNYFQNLLDRSAGRTPVIHPRFPSLFKSPDSSDPSAIGHSTSEHPDSGEKTKQEKTLTKPGISETMLKKETKSNREDISNPQAVADIEAIEPLPDSILHVDAPLQNHRAGIDRLSPKPLRRPGLKANDIGNADAQEIVTNFGHAVLQKPEWVDEQLAPALPSHHTPDVPAFKEKPVKALQRSITDKSNFPEQRVSPANRPATAQTSPVDDNFSRQADHLEAVPVNRANQTSLRHTGTTMNQPSPVFPARVTRLSNIRPYHTAQAARAITPETAFSLPEKQPQEDNIKVTIGRIEVRAVMPQTVPLKVQNAPKMAQPKITLEDYLKKQRGGSR